MTKDGGSSSHRSVTAQGESLPDAVPPVDASDEKIIEAFELAWQQGEPRIGEFLSRPSRQPARLLSELALVDLEYRLKRCEVPSLEHYTTIHPTLATDAGFLATATKMLEAARHSAAVASLAASSLRHDLDDCSFEDFVLEERVGQGGMAVVYRARLRSTNELVAVKVLSPVTRNRDESMLRFLREARAARRFEHPNIIAVRGVGRTPTGALFIAMEFADGGTLADRLQADVPSPGDVVRIVASVANAVEHAHGHGVIHRDLKPDNVLLTAQGDVRVSDFGLAKIMGQGDLTITMGVIGTAGFMAPEQADRRLGTISARTDVYGIGAILYAALTGRPPFVGNSLFQIIDAVCGPDPPTMPRAIRPDIPAALESICLACLQKRPDHRLPSAASVAALLSRFTPPES